jgi:hypothetical protein
MLRLYLRAFTADDTQLLARIADDTGALYTARSKKQREKGQKSSDVSTTLTFLESQGILSNICGSRTDLSLFGGLCISAVVPLYVVYDENPGTKARTIWSSLCCVLPLAEKFSERLRGVRFPERCLDPAVVGIYSFSQVMSIGLSHKCTGMNLVPILRKSFVVGFMHAVSRRIVRFLHNYLFFIPEWMISSYVAFQTAPFIQRVVRYGVGDSMEWLFEWCFHTFTFLIKDISLPLDIDGVPESLQCPICKGLLNDPVESLGKFFCAGCWKAWFGQGKTTHPVTLEGISKEVMSQPLLMKYVVRRYRYLRLRSLRQGEGL